MSEEKYTGDTAESKQSLLRYFRFSSVTEALTKRIQKYKNEKLSHYGLKSMHMTFLCRLYKTDNTGMTPKELAQECGVDKAFISRVTREMEELGYVAYADGQSFKSKSNRRIVLSEKGRQIMNDVNSMLDDAVKKLTDGIPEEQINTFYEVLALFEERLNDLCGTQTANDTAI